MESRKIEIISTLDGSMYVVETTAANYGELKDAFSDKYPDVEMKWGAVKAIISSNESMLVSDNSAIPEGDQIIALTVAKSDSGLYQDDSGRWRDDKGNFTKAPSNMEVDHSNMSDESKEKVEESVEKCTNQIKELLKIYFVEGNVNTKVIRQQTDKIKRKLSQLNENIKSFSI